jgi:hypothetical protein
MDDIHDTPDISGSTLFASVMLVLGALLNVIEATLAWSRAAYFSSDAALPVSDDVSRWAWILLLLGLVQFGAAFGVASGRPMGRWLGIGAASLTLLGQLLFLPARPAWGFVAIAFSVLIIWSLTRFDEPRRTVTPPG